MAGKKGIWNSSDWRLATKGGSALRSGMKFTSYVVFADWRVTGKTPGKDAPFELPGVGSLGALKHPERRWNRVQVTRRLGQIKVELNGKVVIEEKLDESGPLKPGPITLSPKQATQFANLFIKELK